ncbi:hypothetical protein [Serinicoccus profundi]|uniref:hypothetical protein n=1 Tax=Serinicoccus profundi TaxID=1078471 RepID=UPI0011CC77F0|nr:hypothetical protein [Serinicoccus profundi]
MIRLLGPLVRILLLLAAALLPSAWPAGLARPDLVLLVVAGVALLHPPQVGLLVGLAGGWFVDLVPPGAAPLGGGALAYAAVGLGLGAVRQALVLSRCSRGSRRRSGRPSSSACAASAPPPAPAGRSRASWPGRSS